MDIVHLAAVFPEIGVQKILQRTNRQLDPGIGNGEVPGSAGVGVGDGVAHALPFVGIGVELQESLDQLQRLHTEHDPVDRFKFQRVIVKVFNFHQGVPGGEAGPLLLGSDLFQVFVAGLGGCKAVVAVTHGKQQGGYSGKAVFDLHRLTAGQTAQCRRQGVHLLRRQLPAPEMASAQHQIKVVKHFHGVPGGGNGLHTDFLRVVNKEHHMGKLDRRVLTHPDPGRDALQNGAFRSPDQ